MANVFLNIPLPVGNGLGAPVDVSLLGPQKSFYVQGAFNAQISILASADGVNYVPVVTLSNPANEPVELPIDCGFVRTQVQNFVSNSAVTSVGAEALSVAVSAFTLAVPAGNGVGVATSVSTFSAQKTIYIDGAFNCVLTIQGSQDGINYVDILTVDGTCTDEFRVLYTTAAFFRTRIQGYVVGGLPLVTVATVLLTAGSGGGDATNLFVPYGTGLRTIIYARTTGNDTTGDGSLLNPYLTPQRCLDDVPLIIPTTDTYVCDWTGLGLVSFADGLQLNTFRSSGPARLNFAPTIPGAYIEQALVLQATPDPAAGVPIADTHITAGEIVSQVADPITGNITITTTKVWPVNALKGRLLTSSGFFELNVAVASNGVSTLVTDAQAPLTAPLDIVQPSCEIHSTNPGPIFDAGGLYIPNEVPVAIYGLKLTALAGSGLICDSAKVTAGLCEIAGAGFSGGGAPLLYGTHWSLVVGMNGSAPSLLGFFDAITWDNRGQGGSDAMFIGPAWFVGCSAIGSRSSTEPSTIGTWQIRFCNIDSSTGDGIRYLGGVPCVVSSCRIDTSVGDGIDASHPGFLSLSSVVGVGNGGVGALIDNGCQLQAAATTITGAGGDRKVGVNAAAPWGAPETDVTTFSRVY